MRKIVFSFALFLLIPFFASAAGTGTFFAGGAVADYCLKHDCLEFVSSLFKGYGLDVAETSVQVPNCGHSKLMNITVHVPLFSDDVRVRVNGESVCDVPASLFGSKETCLFYLRGAPAGTTGSEIINVNGYVSSVSGERIYSKNFLMEVLHAVSDAEKTTDNNIKSAELKVDAAKSVLADNVERNTTDALAAIAEAETKLGGARERFAACDFVAADALSGEARELGEEAIALLPPSGLTGFLFSGGSNLAAVLGVVLVALAYLLFREKPSRTRVRL